MYTKELGANVPLYGQEQCTWCGSATAQMIRNGYPNPADRQYFTQTYLWNVIQTNNSTDPADIGWATDPHGLRGCLQSLSNPAGVDWAEFADPAWDVVLFDMLFWMNIRQFASGVLVNEGGHWVAVVGFVTDVEPTAGSSPTLQYIHFHDPEPHNVGTDTMMSGSQWFSGPWMGSIIYPGTWYKKYVAIVEPPIAKGKVRVKVVKRTGKDVLSPARAVESAREWIVKMDLADQPRYRLLGHDDVEAMDAILVREETWESRAKNVPQYYIVPFGFKSELADRGGRAIRVALLVNAFTGNLEEVTAFGSPVRYLTKEEALDVVTAALRKDRESLLKEADAVLTFQPSDITHIRTYPFWKITVGKRVMYVDQLGKLYGKLLRSIPGD
jgi:hypothetical protein